MDIEKLLDHAERLSINSDYWFFRTMGGDYYEDFVKNGFIAIGHNEIPLSEIKKAHDSKDPVNTLGTFIKETVKEKNYKYWAVQHLRFAYEIKKNDIVIVPSYSSRKIGIGKVVNEYVETINSELQINDHCPFNKRKKVKFLKIINREELPSEVFRLFYSRHVITNANQYLSYIDSKIYDFYLKGEQAHLVVDIGLKEEINAYELNEFYTELLFFIEDFSNYNKITFDKKDLNIKISLQSPGVIIFFGLLAVGILSLGAMVVLAGGAFESNVDPKTGKSNIKFKTNSLLDKISEYRNSSQERKMKMEMFERNIKALNVKPIKNIQELAENDIEYVKKNIQDSN